MNLKLLCCLSIISIQLCKSDTLPQGNYDGTWVSWIPSYYSFEGQNRNVITIEKNSYSIGRLFPKVEKNQIIGTIIPDETKSVIAVSKIINNSGYTFYYCTTNNSKFLLIFRGDEMSMIDLETKKMINSFKRYDINTPQFREFLHDTDSAASDIEAALSGN